MQQPDAFPQQFAVRLPFFEGPFDLLLYFIERDELDISDIPISKITDEFLGYIRQLERKNLEIASEFILVAATLMKIKARMLLPRPEVDAEGNEIDPRADLVQHLLDYKRFKEAAKDLQELEAASLARFARLNIQEELEHLLNDAEDKAPLVNLTVTNLALMYQKMLIGWMERERYSHHVVVKVPYSVEDQRAFVISRIASEGRVSFSNIMRLCEDKLQVVYTFMAVLEMLNERVVQLLEGEGFNHFWLEPVGLEGVGL